MIEEKNRLSELPELRDRTDAGGRLAALLEPCRHSNAIVFAIPAELKSAALQGERA